MYHSCIQAKVSINVAFRKINSIDTINDRFNADILVEASWSEPRLDADSHQVHTHVRSRCDTSSSVTTEMGNRLLVDEPYGHVTNDRD